MTETLIRPEAQSMDLGSLLAEWVETPPTSMSEALSERGMQVETLEDYVRSGISGDEVEALRRMLVQAAAAGGAEDAALLARLTPLLDPRERAWDRVLRAKTTGETLTATVIEATRGGVVVDLGIRGFVPSSQIGLSVPRSLSQFVGRPMRLRVLEVDRRRQTVILSNRVVMEEERAARRREALSRIEEGEVRQGVVRRLTDIGAFVDVGGVDGLLHVSEISWKRVEQPSDLLKVGQKVQVKVLRVDPHAGRVSLSMRHLTPDPWEEARRKYQPGTTTKVTIARTMPQGAVVDLEEGLEGFIPISELSPRRVATAEEVVQPGQEVEAVVLDLRLRERRIVFSLRKLEQKRDRQVVDTYQKKVQRTSERTTLGDLFGHLFEEYQPAPEETVEAAAVQPPAEAAVPTSVDEEETSSLAAAAAVAETSVDEAETPSVAAEAAVADLEETAAAVAAEPDAEEESILRSEEEPESATGENAEARPADLRVSAA